MESEKNILQEQGTSQLLPLPLLKLLSHMGVSQVFDVKPQIYMICFFRRLLQILLVGLPRFSPVGNVFNMDHTVICIVISLICSIIKIGLLIHSSIRKEATVDNVPSI